MYCDSCDALVLLKFGAGVRYLSLSRSTVPEQGEVGLFFVFRYSIKGEVSLFFAFRFSFFAFRFSFFDIQIRAEYRILTFKILF